MYQIGERVIYGMHGVCRIAQKEDKRVDGKLLRYLVLEPTGQPGARYLVPEHNAAAMAKVKPILSPGEFQALLASEQVRSGSWVPEENQRKRIYREMMTLADREQLMTMVHTLYRQSRTLEEMGRKLHQCDENFLRDAEKLLSGEISLIMELEAGAAKQYLRNALKP